MLAGADRSRRDRIRITVKAMDPASTGRPAVGTATAKPSRQGRGPRSGRLAGVASCAARSATQRRERTNSRPRRRSPRLARGDERLRQGQDLNYAGGRRRVEGLQDAVALDPASLGPTPASASSMARSSRTRRSRRVTRTRSSTWIGCPSARSCGRRACTTSSCHAQLREGDRELRDARRRLSSRRHGPREPGVRVFERADVPKAVEEGRKAIEIYPRNTLQRTNYAMYSMYAGDFTTAIAESKTVLEGEPVIRVRAR